MKSYTLKFNQENRISFDELKSGSKPVETRAATVKYQPIEVGNELIFSCGDEKFARKVARKEHFKSINEMVKEIPFKQIMPWVKDVDEMKKAYSSYPDYNEKIREFGIFAFWLE